MLGVTGIIVSTRKMNIRNESNIKDQQMEQKRPSISKKALNNE